MPNRKLFPKYPSQWGSHPDILDKRVTAIEDHLEQSHLSSNGSPGLFAPIMVLLVEILSGLSLVSQEARDTFLKLLGH